MLPDTNSQQKEKTPFSRLETIIKTPLGTVALITTVAWLIYYPCLNNYFTWDDFIWLMKIKSLPKSPGQMFRIEAVYGGSAYYFDPLIYLSFWFDHLVAGLNYRWYHVVDIMLHCSNGVLVFLVARTLSKEFAPALMAALIFVSSFAIVDTVVWSSSRVDLFATLFSLFSLLSFIRYLHADRTGSLVMSVISFTLALCCKGTPIILPLPLLILMIQEKRPLRDYRSLLGHILVAVTYVILLVVVMLSLPKGTTANGIHLHGNNVLIAVQSMVIPEARLAQMNPLIATSLTALFLLSLLMVPSSRSSQQLKLFGLGLLTTAMLPLLIIKDFNLVTDLTNAGHLLTSPSHRIYLAYTGMAFILGGGLYGVVQWAGSRLAGGTMTAAAVILTLLAWNGVEVRAREQLWDGSAQLTRNFVEGFAPFRNELQSNAMLVLINPPISRGFTTGALNVLYGIENPLLLPVEHIPREIIDSPEIFQNRHRAGLFVFTGNRIHNFSSEFRTLVDISFRHLISTDPVEKAMLQDSYMTGANVLNSSIHNLR